MRDAETFVISRLMWFDTPRSTATHNRARERYTAEIQPVSAVAQVVQQSGPRTFWERGSKWIDEQSKPIYVELREQFLFGKKLDCETGEPLLQNIPSKLAALISGNAASQNTATDGGATVLLPIATRGSAV